MYQALYRKYRPKTFSDVVGQDVIVKTLQNSIKNNVVTHAYLLTGPRGTGKTSIAKIFAKILNCHNLKGTEPCNKCISCEQANNNQNIDIIEIDAASNNGVEEIREIRNKITLVPTNSKYKIYIIDEVHMLTNQAFNALLKTLEEPPAHIIFIFATTEPHKIPKTVLSRCQRFDYKKISESCIVERLKYIVEQEKIDISEDALKCIAKVSDGGMRDSISLLDQAVAYSDSQINVQDIHDINGSLIQEDVDQFIINLLNNNLFEVLKSLEEYDNSGKSIFKIVQEIIDRLKNCLIFFNAPTLVKKEKFYEDIKSINNNKGIYLYIKVLSEIIPNLRNVNDGKLLLEIELIRNMSIENNYEHTIQNKKQDEIKKEVVLQEKCGKVEKIETKSEISTYNKEKMELLKEIRIKNSLCKFSQREREKIKEQILELNDFLSDENYGKFVSLINDGELKAVSDEYLMFMYKSELLENSFNLEIRKIEDMFLHCLKKKYRVIAINLNDWDFIRKDYNLNKDKYIYQKEENMLEEVFLSKKISNNNKKNSIEDMFNGIIEYE